MPDIAVAVAQVPAAQAWSDPEAVERNARQVAAIYRDLGDDVDLVVLPELALTGYIPLKGYDQRRKRILAEAAGEAVARLEELAALTRDGRALLVVGLMEPAEMRNEVYNSVALLEGGELRAVYRKIHLPVEENHYFLPGDEVVAADTRIGRIGLLVCYDLLFPEVGRVLALRGTDCLVVASNWLDIANLRRLGQVLPAARALEGHMHVVFVNGVGELEARGRRWALFGESRLVSATGRELAIASSEEEILRGVLPAADLEAADDVFPVMRDRRPDVYLPLVREAAAHARLRPARSPG